MLDELTPDQRAKLARGWAWQVGQAAIWTNLLQTHKVRVHVDTGRERRLVVIADGERHMALVRDLAPDLNDPVTADGLLRTARAMWRDESLHVVPVGVDFTVSPKRVLRWRLRRAVYWLGVVTEEWGETGWITSAVECPRPIDFASEEAALLAAILVAPEHQNV